MSDCQAGNESARVFQFVPEVCYLAEMLKTNPDTMPHLGKFNVVYSTAKGKLYPLEVGFGVTPVSKVPVNVALTIEACRRGCRLYGRNGGCPPFAPGFHEIPGKELLILYAKLLTRHFPPRVLSGPYYSRWVFIETFMAPLMNRVGSILASSIGGCFLSSGNCRSCRPKRCAVKDGHPCRNPHARTFSLEATGVLVSEMIKDVFGFDLQWWRRNDLSHVPEYMVKVVGLKGEGFAEKGCELDMITKALTRNRMSIHEYSSSTSDLSSPSSCIST